jgi:site-specific DNA-methyltransferase (adenine-specific)
MVKGLPQMSLYYQDDYVTLYHGDCITEHREWLDADLLVTDPPYGLAYDGGFRRKNGSRTDKVLRVQGDDSTSTRDAALDAWGDKPALAFGTWKVARPAGVRNVLIWDKGNYTGVGNTDIPWGQSHEEVYVLGKWPKIKSGGNTRDGGAPARGPSVLRASAFNTQDATRPDHPTPKPVGLMELLVARCPVGVIADPFAGSGSTLVAARNLGRRAVGAELEERYCEIIAQRLSQDLLKLEWTV